MESYFTEKRLLTKTVGWRRSLIILSIFDFWRHIGDTSPFIISSSAILGVNLCRLVSHLYYIFNYCLMAFRLFYINNQCRFGVPTALRQLVTFGGMFVLTEKLVITCPFDLVWSNSLRNKLSTNKIKFRHGKFNVDFLLLNQ
jgi:hypothetical protein